MNQIDSAVDFPTAARIHLAFGTRDLDASVAFYSSLFGLDPVKRKDDYVKFEVHEPPLNLSLHPVAEPTVAPVPEHLGIQVKSVAEVVRRAAALEAAGYPQRREEGTTCCYALQDKAWVADPEGRMWEVFVVLEADAAVHSDAPEPAADEAACCAPSCCA